MIYKKFCSQCGVEKPHDAFQKRKASKDGFTASCKACLKIRDAIRDSSPERKKVKRDYAATDTGRERSNAAKRAFDRRNPKKRSAHIAVGNAVRDGKLIRPDNCEKCNSVSALEAHHCDYNKPLDVMWLCDPCHKKWHKENDPIV